MISWNTRRSCRNRRNRLTIIRNIISSTYEDDPKAYVKEGNDRTGKRPEEAGERISEKRRQVLQGGGHSLGALGGGEDAGDRSGEFLCQGVQGAFAPCPAAPRTGCEGREEGGKGSGQKHGAEPPRGRDEAEGSG